MEGPRVKTLCAENEGPFHVSQDLIPTGVMMRIAALSHVNPKSVCGTSVSVSCESGPCRVPTGGRSLADAEVAEDDVEVVLDVDAPCQAAEVPGCHP